MLALLLVGIGALGGCLGKKEVTGQVFVVTQGGENVTLGLVGIHEADRLLRTGQKDRARPLFEALAARGNAEAHFVLAFHYDSDAVTRLRHYEAAALGGHEEAFRRYVVASMYGMGVDRPPARRVLEVCRKVRMTYRLAVSDDEQKAIVALETVADVPALDVGAFERRTGVDLRAASEGLYGIWSMAEEASRDGRFGKADPTLTMQLILLEGPARVEMDDAIRDYLPRWRAGLPHPFDLCDHVSSGLGAGFCADLKARKQEKIRAAKLARFRGGLEPRVAALLYAASAAHEKFATLRADHEQGFFGSARASFAIESVQEQREEFLRRVVGAGKGKHGPKPQPFRTTDAALNSAWRDLLRKVRASPEDALSYNVSEEGLRATQRAWLRHRDAVAALLAALDPTLTEDQHRSRLTAERTRQLVKAPDAFWTGSESPPHP